MIPRIFDGQDVVIVSGGPSLKPYINPDPAALQHLLKGRNVIAINRALEYLPEAQVLYWTDVRFWRSDAAKILAHPARWKATGNMEYRLGEIPRDDRITQYLFTGMEGFDEDPRHLRHGLNSTYAATHLAVHLGARRIVLLGLDLKTAAGRNFHSGYVDGDPLESDSLTRWKRAFAGLAPILAEKGIVVINGSPESSLTLWPRFTPADAVSCLDGQPERG